MSFCLMGTTVFCMVLIMIYESFKLEKWASLEGCEVGTIHFI